MQTDLLITAGIALVLVGILLIVLGSLLHAGSDRDTDVETGGIILIGPIPIIFGNNKKLIGVAVAGAVLLALYALLRMQGSP